MNILIVEKDPVTREHLNALLGGLSDFARVETHPSAEHALKNAVWRDTHILMTEIDLPGQSGLDLIRHARASHPRVCCLVHSHRDNRDTVLMAIQAGACGYLLKSGSPLELIEGLRELHEGGSPLSPKIARMVLYELRARDPGSVEDENPFTAREREVLRQLDEGATYKDVAAQLNISPHTVHSHVKKANEKVSTSNRGETIQLARRQGWL